MVSASGKVLLYPYVFPNLIRHVSHLGDPLLLDQANIKGYSFTTSQILSLTFHTQAIHEYGMVRAGDKVLVCLSGSRESIALLHTMHQYQFYARAKGLHFSIGEMNLNYLGENEKLWRWMHWFLS